jgi:hypothetical protein
MPLESETEDWRVGGTSLRRNWVIAGSFLAMPTRDDRLPSSRRTTRDEAMTSDPTATAEPTRPNQVTLATGLLALFPVIIIVSVVLTFVALGTAEVNAERISADLSRRGYDSALLVDSMLSTMRAQLIAGAVIKAIQAVALGALALFVFRGSQNARIGVYLVAGVATVGSVGLVAVTEVMSAFRSAIQNRVSGTGLVFVTEADVLPGWFTWYNYTTVFVTVVLAIVIVVLLTRPQSNAFFRRGRPVSGPAQPYGHGPHGPQSFAPHPHGSGPYGPVAHGPVPPGPQPYGPPPYGSSYPAPPPSQPPPSQPPPPATPGDRR